MQAELTDKGLLIPREWLESMGAFEIVREPGAIIILPRQLSGLVRQSIVPSRPRSSARGKYVFVATSSDEFAARKAEEIRLEEKP